MTHVIILTVGSSQRGLNLDDDIEEGKEGDEEVKPEAEAKESSEEV